MRRIALSIATVLLLAGVAPPVGATRVRVDVVPSGFTGASDGVLRRLADRVPERPGIGTVAKRYVSAIAGEVVVLDARRVHRVLVGIDVHTVTGGAVAYHGSALVDESSRYVYTVDASGMRSGGRAVDPAQACSSNCNLASAVGGSVAGLACSGAATGAGVVGGQVGAFLAAVGCTAFSGYVGYVVADNCDTATMCTPLIKWTQFTCGYPGCQGLGFILSPFRLTPDFTSVWFPSSGRYQYTSPAHFYFRTANVGGTLVTPWPTGSGSPFTYVFSHDLPIHPFVCPDGSYVSNRVAISNGSSDPAITPVVGGCDGLRG